MINKTTVAFISLVSLCLLNSKVIAREDIDFTHAKYEEKQIVCMAKNIYYESGHESHEGKLAVAQVTIDRKSTRLNSSHIPLSRMPSSA